MKNYLFIFVVMSVSLLSCSENISDNGIPNNFKILFVEGEPGSNDGKLLHTMNGDGTERKLIRDFSFCYLPQWSPDGQYIYFGHKRNIYRMKSDGTSTNQIVEGGLFRISTFGDKICYEDNSNENILYCINVDGSNKKKVFESNRPIDEMTWSPNGKSVVLTDRVNDYQLVNIYLVHISDESIDTLATDINLWPGMTWSNDGKFILLNRNEGIYKMEISNKELTQLTPSALRNLDAIFSPDDSKIVFATIPASFGSKLNIVGSDGNGLREIPGTEIGVLIPRWTPDGKRICYINRNSIKLINADGSEKITLIEKELFLDNLEIVVK